MFDIFPQLLSSIASFLFPLFASYKALKTSDPAQLAPWLMYWVVMAVAILVESWTEWILVWIPFYAYVRLLFHLYLVLPQTQGARHLYQTYLEPYVRENEADIDMFIASAHERLKRAGMAYIKRAIEWARVNMLHLPPDENLNREYAMEGLEEEETPQSYTAGLLSRFALPSARGVGSVGGDFYSLLANAATSAIGMSGGSGAGPAARPAGVRGAPDMTASGTLIPENLREANAAEQVSFLAAQRERLQILVGALDREAAAISMPGAFGSEPLATPGSSAGSGMSRPASGLSKSRSEADFEKIDAESGAEEEGSTRRRSNNRTTSSGSSWMPWGGGSGAKSSGYERSD
ncbi:Receptor expression-enhancing protein 2 [Zalerion maritima]|uniref:Protein YOP1 n=1 Tax=Zalerion maritima TaxID=339359 RepID=A0AAD5RLF2_9PEZI|nr:Receptor expression-enhancing protein 2 [Zalerion maritima]